MNLRLLMLFLGTCSSHWVAASNVTYILTAGTLMKVEATDARNIDLSTLGIERLHVNSLLDLEKVVSLDLSNNPLRNLPPGIFSNLKNLRKLSLYNNHFYSFNSTSVGLTNLEYLDLSENYIPTLNRGDLFGVTKSGKVMISTVNYEISSGIFKNPSVPVRKNEETATNENSKPWQFHYYGPFRICISVDGILESINMAEYSYQGICTSQSQITQPYKIPDIYYEMPVALTMVVENITNVKENAFGTLKLDLLNLAYNRLRSTGFAKTLPKTIRKLYLYGNPISEVPVDSFYGLKNLTELRMRYMQVNNIEPGTFRDQENLLELSLDHNKISVLKSGFFQGLHSLESISLEHNQIKKISSNLFEGCNHPSPKLALSLIYNSINIIENGAFSRGKLKELNLQWNPLEDDSIREGAFNGSVISKLLLQSNALTRFNEEWFNGVSGLKEILLSSTSVQRIEKGFAKHMKDVIHLHLKHLGVEILQNGALFGLSTEREVTIHLWVKHLRTIEGGVFDDL